MANTNVIQVDMTYCVNAHSGFVTVRLTHCIAHRVFRRYNIGLYYAIRTATILLYIRNVKQQAKLNERY